MLDLGVCRWDHIVLGISARSHMDAATLRRAWQGEKHMAKLSVNAMIGLACAAAAGADFSQAFAYEGAWCGTSSTPEGC